VKTRPGSQLAGLVRAGIEYTKTQTTFPSDSFPGMVAQLTGAGPGTAGVYYDDTFNRKLLPPGTVDCATTVGGPRCRGPRASTARRIRSADGRYGRR